MIPLLIFVNTIALYFLLAFVFSWVSRVAFQSDSTYERERETSQDQNQPVRVELILANSGEQIEYVIRHLIYYSKIKGVPVLVFPRDRGSKDETLSILNLFRRDYPGLIREEQEPGDWKVDLQNEK